MEIKCPNCGKTLELPTGAVGKRVKCSFCGMKFIGDDTKALLVQSEQSIDIKLNDALDGLDDGLRNHILFTRDRIVLDLKEQNIDVKVSDVFTGYHNVIIMFSVVAGASYAKVEKMLREYEGTGQRKRTWQCIPGLPGLAVEFKIDNNCECEPISDFLSRPGWKSMVLKQGSIPFPLGVDIANRDIVLDLSEFSVLSFVRSDMPSYEEFLIPRLKALYSVRSNIEFHFVGCGRREVLPGPAGLDIGNDSEMPWLDTPNDEASMIEWCDNAVKTLTNIENEVEVRKRLFESAEVSDVSKYNQKSNHPLNHIVVVARDLPEWTEWKENYAVKNKAFEPLDKLANIASISSRRFGVHFLLSYSFGYHDSMSNLIGGLFDPYSDMEIRAGIVMHWGNWDAVDARKGFLGPEAVRIRSGRFFVYRSPDNEVQLSQRMRLCV